MREQTFIVLLRGINVGGIRMATGELRTACADLGWAGVQTYIQSGNVVLRAETTAREVEAALEREIQRRFHLAIPVIVRTSGEWRKVAEGNPFPRESETEPSRVMLAIAKAKPKAEAAAALQERATSGERVARAGDALWIHFAKGVARSKISPGLLDKVVGSPVTTRNWRTVVKLDELARA